ncbi:MAG: hypothetical protein EBU51_05855 [Synechococcaceae bacterium WB6_3A_227]|nr:hypothetical protein [Synechococcaceae bacterium WB6_3A_227]
MPCTPDRSLLFIHIPKTGGSSIEQALGIYGPWQLENQEILFGLIQSEELLAHGWGSAFLQHLSWRELQHQWDFSAAKRFAAVRNPWARFASVYTNTDSHLKEVARLQGLELEGISFEEFVDATEQLEHAHLRPQLDYLVGADGELAVNNLLRTEQLNANFQQLCKQLGLELELPWVHRSSPRSQPFEDLYSPASWQRIGERYAMDVEKLGYGAFA